MEWTQLLIFIARRYHPMKKFKHKSGDIASMTDLEYRLAKRLNHGHDDNIVSELKNHYFCKNVNNDAELQRLRGVQEFLQAISDNILIIDNYEVANE